jgi:hypothetical protein
MLAKAIAKLQGVEIQTRELVDEWLLITYDIPVSEEGNKARFKFLKLAPTIGAVMHSRSVYLMPNTQQAQLAGVELSKTVGGEVYMWCSKVVGGMSNEDVTRFYDRKINEQIDHIVERMEAENLLITEQKFGMADRMHRKTVNLFNQVLFSCVQRGSGADTIQRLALIEMKLFGESEKGE